MTQRNKQHLSSVLTEIHKLISRHHLEVSLFKRQNSPQNEVSRKLLALQHAQELGKYLNSLHGADIADLLESLPQDDRLFLWKLLPSKLAAFVLIEVPSILRKSLIEALDKDALINIAFHLDSDELVDITPYLTESTLAEIITSLDEQARLEYEEARQFEDSQVGSIMDFDQIKVRNDVTCKVVLRYLRRFEELPPKTDQIFIVDDFNKLVGSVTFRQLLVSKPKTPITEVMIKELHVFTPQESAHDVANAFERYDLTTAAVVDEHYRLIGRLTVDDMIDVLREESDKDVFNMAGFNNVQDIFSPVIEAFKSRWVWLVVNLCTAFLASRVIGLFEGSIEKIVALASLMPIVAGIGGNAGNQTITMIVRAMNDQKFTWQQIKAMLINELLVALLNGVIWGSVLGLITWFMYDYAMLGLVMIAAMSLNLVLAATAGVLIPYTMQRIGRDPALGSSVLITACTDSGGFFIFLGLANLILL